MITVRHCYRLTYSTAVCFAGLCGDVELQFQVVQHEYTENMNKWACSCFWIYWELLVLFVFTTPLSNVSILVCCLLRKCISAGSITFSFVVILYEFPITSLSTTVFLSRFPSITGSHKQCITTTCSHILISSSFMPIHFGLLPYCPTNSYRICLHWFSAHWLIFLNNYSANGKISYRKVTPQTYWNNTKSKWRFSLSLCVDFAAMSRNTCVVLIAQAVHMCPV